MQAWDVISGRYINYAKRMHLHVKLSTSHAGEVYWHMFNVSYAEEVGMIMLSMHAMYENVYVRHIMHKIDQQYILQYKKYRRQQLLLLLMFYYK